MTDQDHRPNGSQWTFASLCEYLLRVVADLEKHVKAELMAQEKAVSAALAAADKAVAKAESGTRDWQQAANEWRGAMSDRERTFISRTEHEKEIIGLKEKIAALAQSSTHLAGARRGQAETVAYVIAGIGLLIGLAGVLVGRWQ